MSRILVTGSAGFIGSHLVDALIQQKHTVYGIDNFSGGKEENITPQAKRNFYKCDLRRRNVTNLVMRIARPDIVYHVAAFAHEGLSQFAPTMIIENNVNASMNVLVAAIRQNIKRFVFTSSTSVYGEQPVPFPEDAPRKPADIYGVTKAAFENMLEIMSGVYGFEYVIIRPHNVYGERQNMADPYRNVIAIFMNMLLQDKRFYIYGDGEQRRSFSHVDDVVRAIVEAGFRKINREIINIGPTRDYSINDLAHRLLKISGKTHILPIHIDNRPAEVKHAYCTNDKAKRLLDYKTTIKFNDGLKRMWEWAKKMGPQEPKYLPQLELTMKDTPKTWIDHLI